jgi:nucleotide-binding universal stress UspA family protein
MTCLGECYCEENAKQSLYEVDSLMFQRPLICTDLTDGLQRLVEFVPSLVAGGMTDIVFLHIVPFPEDENIPQADVEKIDRAKNLLSTALKQVPKGATVKVEVQSGRTLDGILKMVTTHQSDVLILGTQNRNLLTEKLFGSTTTELSQRSPIPLLTLRPQLISTYTSEELELRCQHLFRYLMLPYDDSSPSKQVVERIKHFAENQSDRALKGIILCWVVEEGGRNELTLEQQQSVVCNTLEPVRDDLANCGLEVTLDVRRGNSIAEVLAAAQESDVSAIGLSTDNIGGLLNWSVPSFAGEILRRSWHPVLFFPSKR